MRLVFGFAGGVDHQKQVAAEIRHHQIVEDASRTIGELRVALPASRDGNNVLRHQPLQRLGRVLDLAGFRAERDLAHMRNVKQAGVAAGMQVFPEHARGVLHRHVVAGKRHHLAALRDMQRVQRGSFQLIFGFARKHHRALAVPKDDSSENLSKPHLSLCLRVLSRRRTRPGGQARRRLFPDVIKSRGPFA